MSVTELTELLGYRKQSYYKRIKLEEKKDITESLVISLVKQKRKLWKKGSGRNLHAALKEDFKRHRNLSIEMRQIFYLIKQHILMFDRPFLVYLSTPLYQVF